MAKNKVKAKGFSLRATNYALFAVVVLFLVLSIIIISSISERFHGLVISLNDYSDVRDSIDAIERGSDYLTEQSRQYVIFGDRVYMDNYFDETDNKKSRENALDSLVNDFGIDRDVIDTLEDALDSQKY